MAKHHYPEEPSESDLKAAKKFISPYEKLGLITGYGDLWIRQQFTRKVIFPGGIFIVLALIYAFFRHVSYTYALLIGFILSIIYAIIATAYLKKSHKYILTSRRLIVISGIFHIKVTSVLYDKITHIEIDQPFLHRVFFRHGTIILNTAGGEKDFIKLHYVQAPMEFKSILERLVNENRRHEIKDAEESILPDVFYGE